MNENKHRLKCIFDHRDGLMNIIFKFKAQTVSIKLFDDI